MLWNGNINAKKLALSNFNFTFGVMCIFTISNLICIGLVSEICHLLYLQL